MRVVVAPLFSNWPAFETPFDGMGLDVAWDDRPHVELEVADDETLGDTLERAAEELGVRVAPGPDEHRGVRELLTFNAFHYSDDRTAVRSRYSYAITIVRDDGLAYWEQPFKEATWAEVRRAKEAGLLGDRDIRRLYLVLATPGANGVLPGWADLVSALIILRWIIGAMADAEGAAQFIERIRPRLSRAESAISESAMELEERGALPDNLAASLGAGPWHLADLAGYLGVSEDRAQGILEGFGFGEDAAGLWRLKQDDAARLLYYLREESEIAHTGPRSGEADAALRDRLKHYVRTGSRAELPKRLQQQPWHELTEEQLLARHAEVETMADESMPP